MKLIIGHRPGKRTKADLQAAGITHMLTLLCEKERPATCEAIAGEIGAAWIHFPMEGAKLETLSGVDMEGLLAIHDRLAAAPEPVTLFVHCSAGIHRTGFVTYLFLRRAGLDPAAAKAELGVLRPLTGEEAGAERLTLAEEMFCALPT